MERDFMGLNAKENPVVAVKEEIVEESNDSVYGRDSGGPSLFSSKAQLLGGDFLLPSTAVAGTTDQWTNIKASEVPTQFTIFYNGTVHVFDNISPEKAGAIILLAGKGIVSNLAQAKNQVRAPVVVQETGEPSQLFLNGALANQSMIMPKCSTMPSPISVSLNVTAADNDNIKVPNTISMSPALAAIKVESPVMRSSGTLKDIPLARKISVARFLEKRKERAMKAAPYNLIKKEADSATSGSGCFEVSTISGVGSCSGSSSKEINGEA